MRSAVTSLALCTTARVAAVRSAGNHLDTCCFTATLSIRGAYCAAAALASRFVSSQLVRKRRARRIARSTSSSAPSKHAPEGGAGDSKVACGHM